MSPCFDRQLALYRLKWLKCKIGFHKRVNIESRTYLDTPKESAVSIKFRTLIWISLFSIIGVWIWKYYCNEKKKVEELMKKEGRSMAQR